MSRTAALEDPLIDKVREFLHSIPKEDVIHLARTSTAGLMKADNVHEAISIILRYSDAVTLLNRKRIKTSYLAEYLHSHNVPFSIPGTKTSLSRHLLEYWGVQGSQKYAFSEDKQIDRHPENPASVVVAERSTAGVQIQFFPEVPLPSPESTGHTLACQFVPWFYNMLNELNNFESNHFWPKCNLRLEIAEVVPVPVTTETSTGAETCALLRSLVEVEGIHFNPNTLNGVGIKGRITPHGLVEVVACGTVHRNKSDFGVFVQMFSLLRDPLYDNNFKILNSILRFGRTGTESLSSIENIECDE